MGQTAHLAYSHNSSRYRKAGLGRRHLAPFSKDQIDNGEPESTPPDHPADSGVAFPEADMWIRRISPGPDCLRAQ
jgi:hypothetical protein